MQTILSILLILVWVTPTLAAEKPAQLVSVYCFSEDLEAGFKDEVTEYWCEQLAKRGQKKKSLMLVAKDDAIISVKYLGTEEIATTGEATYLLGGYAWAPNQFRKGARAILDVEGYTKGFHAEGINFQGPGEVLRQLEEWIRENRATILEKASQK